MKIAFLFPGQGSQTIGMGQDIYEKYEDAKNVYEKVKAVTGIDVAKMTFEGNEETLNETKNTQIAIFTMSLAILAVLEKNQIQAEAVAGLSLGEYAALVYSKAIGFEEGAKLLQKRGQYMQELAPKGEWSMAAIMGMENSQVEQICNQVTNGFVVPANYNCNGQIVISGEKEAVAQASILAKELGASKVRELKTAGPFHTEKLMQASTALKVELQKVEIHPFDTTVIKNIDGLPYSQQDDVKEILAKHIVSPVQFGKTIETMLETGIDTFVEVGPGKALSGFVKRNVGEKQVSILNIQNLETLQNTIEFLGGKINE